jgi:hypothetical protein
MTISHRTRFKEDVLVEDARPTFVGQAASWVYRVVRAWGGGCATYHPAGASFVATDRG